MTSAPPRVVVLTRDGSSYGLRLLNALHRAGLAPDAVVVADESIRRRWRLLRSVARKVGWGEALGAAAEGLSPPWARTPDTWRHARFVTEYERLTARVVRVSSFNSPAGAAAVGDLHADWILLGQTGILKPLVLATAKRGVLNGHPGWLPEYRGVHPAAWTLAEGRLDLLGSTLHVVDAGVDTGPIVQRRALDRSALPPYQGLEDRLYEDCIDLLVEAAHAIRSDTPLVRTPQLPGSGRQYSVAPRQVRRDARRAYGALLGRPR